MVNIQTKYVELVKTVQGKNWKQWRIALHISNSYHVFHKKVILEIIGFPAKTPTTECNYRNVAGMKPSPLILMKTNNFKQKIVCLVPGTHYIYKANIKMNWISSKLTVTTSKQSEMKFNWRRIKQLWTHPKHSLFFICCMILNLFFLLLKYFSSIEKYLTHFSPMSHLYTTWKRQNRKPMVSWLFQGVYECDIGLKWVKNKCLLSAKVW